MKIDAILGAGLSIIMFGLAIGLPNLSSQLLFDFSQLDTLSSNILRIGLIFLGYYFLNTGLDNTEAGL